MADSVSGINIGRIVHMIGSLFVLEALVVLAVLIALAVLARRAHRRETSQLVALVGPHVSPSSPRVRARYDASAADDTRRRAASAPEELAAQERIMTAADLEAGPQQVPAPRHRTLARLARVHHH